MAFAVAAALGLTACVTDGVIASDSSDPVSSIGQAIETEPSSAADVEAEQLPQTLRLTEGATGEVELFIAETISVLETDTISFDERFSRRCRHLEGVHSPVDPLISELDRFYTSNLADEYGLTGASTFDVGDAGPDVATARISSASGTTSTIDLAFEEGAWHLDSCEPSAERGRKLSLQADGSAVVTVDSDNLDPIERADAMLGSWVAGQSGYYPWLSMRCRADLTALLGPSATFTLRAANDPDTFSDSDAKAAALSSEILDTLDDGRAHLTLPALLESRIATAGADAATEDEVTIWVTLDDRQVAFSTRWVEEAGNLYNDECTWLGAEDDLVEAFDPEPEVLALLDQLIDELDTSQFNFFDRYSARCRANEDVLSDQDPRLSRLSTAYTEDLRKAGVETPLLSNVVSVDAERVVIQLGSESTKDSILAFAFEEDGWRIDSCDDAQDNS